MNILKINIPAEAYARICMSRASRHDITTVLQSAFSEAHIEFLPDAGRKENSWNGEGLPPVGTVCEYKSYQLSEPWREVEVIAHFRNKAMVAAFIPTGDGDKKVDQAIAKCFRPIRTPEQIAAEAVEQRLAKDVELYGTSFALTNDDGTITRLDPTKVVIRGQAVSMKP